MTAAMRLYTEAEARSLLPHIIPVVEQIQAAFVELRTINAAISVERRGASGDGHLVADAWEGAGEPSTNRMEELGRKLREDIARLDTWGVELKDPAKGLIDFYHERDGEVVYLCYMLGEPDIQYWHSLSGGFSARSRL